MVPGPLLGAPPETDQVTCAAPPAASLAENCSTDVPCLPVVLQPVQLVSMKSVPGDRLKVAFEGSAATPPAAQPAKANSTGGSSSAASLEASLLKVRERAHICAGLAVGRSEPAASCPPYGKIPILSSEIETLS